MEGYCGRRQPELNMATIEEVVENWDPKNGEGALVNIKACITIRFLQELKDGRESFNEVEWELESLECSCECNCECTCGSNTEHGDRENDD